MTLPNQIYSNGFTFIELLIALTIISIISIAGFINIRTLRMEEEFKTAVEDVKSNLGLVYTNSVANVQCQSPDQKWVYEQGHKYLKVYCATVSISGTLGDPQSKTLTIENKNEERTYNFKTNITTSQVYTTSNSCNNNSPQVSATYLIFTRLTGTIDRWFGDPWSIGSQISMTRPTSCVDQNYYIFELSKDGNPTEYKCVEVSNAGVVKEVIYRNDSARCYR